MQRGYRSMNWLCLGTTKFNPSIPVTRAQKSATTDCLREAVTQALAAAQAGKDARKNGASVEGAIAIYNQNKP